ncbi:MAG: glycosyltransferase [Planctomycetes bacterium]|nr:glycosyltransferase [Planctomycetota bacterium]
MADRLNGNPPSLLVFADDWGRHPSSCQHLIRRLRKDMRVLWVNSIGTRQIKADSLTFRRGAEKLRNWSRGLAQVAEQMWVLDVPMLPGLGTQVLRNVNRSLVTARLRSALSNLGMTRPVVLTTLPYIGWLINDLSRRALVYYCTDDYSHWPSADREALQEADREMTESADLILAASQALVRSHDRNGRCQYFPHAVDFEHFSAAQRQAELPADLEILPRPRIGFFGLIYEKIDFELLAGVARRFPHGSLVMIGPKAYCPAAFADIPNVHLLGPRPYEDLPRNIAGLDVLLLPYVNDDMIRQSGPLKLRECLASGKPTVSIDIPNVRTLAPHVRIGGTHEQFIHEVEQALAKPLGSQDIRAMQKAVEPDSWDRRAKQLRAAIEPLILATRPYPVFKNGDLGSAPRLAIHLNGFRTNGTVRVGDAPVSKAPLRILELRSVCGTGGGPDKTILLGAAQADPSRYAVTVCYLRDVRDPGFVLDSRAARLGLDYVEIRERHSYDWKLWPALRRLIRDRAIDIVHSHDYKTDLFALMLARAEGVIPLTTVHGWNGNSLAERIYYFFHRRLLARFPVAIAVSEPIRQTLLQHGAQPARIRRVRNGIDHVAFQRSPGTREKVRHAWDLPQHSVVLGAVGRLEQEKRFDLLLEAAARVRIPEPVHVVLVGEGSCRGELLENARKLGLENRLHLLGHRDDVKDLHQGFDVYVQTSDTEGIPNAVLEAMALETPVVATDVGGTKEIISDGVHGWLTPRRDAEALAQAIGEALSEPARTARIVHAARHRIENELSFSARLRAVEAIYEELAAARRTKGAAGTTMLAWLN